MGHTVAPMRLIIYGKIEQLKKMINGMREPDRSIAESLLLHIHQHISSINFSNPLPNEIEHNMLFAMLVEEKKQRCSGIDDLTLFIFSLIVLYKHNQSKNPDESNIHRLLQAGQ